MDQGRRGRFRARTWRARALAGLAGVATLVLSGCDMVILDAPVGDRPAALDAEAVAGIWYRVEDEAVPFHARLTGDGAVLIAAIGESDEAFVLEQIPITITTADGALYVSGPADEVAGGGYYFGKVVAHERDRWTILAPDAEAFETAISDGRLDGEVVPSDHNKVVRARAADVAAFLRAHPDASVWSEERTIVIRRFDPMGGLE